MKAVVFQGPFEVAVEDVPDPRREKPQDAVIRITTANICGSDLHPYEGRAPLDEGMVLGHENMGVVVETGDAVERIGVGDRVSVPFNIACGTCRNCTAGWTNACLRANPSGKPTGKEGRIGFDYGTVFDRNIALGHGQCPVKRYNRQLRDLIITGRAAPGLITSHELPLEEAPRAYDRIDKRTDGWTKVLLHSQAA